MIIDASALPPSVRLTSRFCIVGSGMGGSAVATALAARGEPVLLVEAGGFDEDTNAGGSVAAEHAGRPFNMPVTRCIEVGGTSNQWHGICAPLDDLDFERRDWIPGSGWPVRRTDLDPYYDEAARMLDIRDPQQFDPRGLPASLRARLGDLQFNDRLLDHKIVQFRKPPIRWKERLEAWARGRTQRLVINAPALELELGEDGATVRSMTAGAGDGTLTVHADVFVVCGGALETPRLLLNSRRRAPRGIGNDRDLVGRYLTDHPVGHFCKLRFHRPTRAPAYASVPVGSKVGLMTGLRLTPAQQREHRLPNHYVWIRPSVSPNRIDDELLLSFLGVRGAFDLTARQALAILTNRDILYRIMVHRFGFRPAFRYGDLFFMTEQIPNPDSRVSLSATHRDRHGYPAAKIDWQLTPDDIRAFHRYARLLLEQGLRSGQYELGRRDEAEVWDRTLASAAHHLGTCRMGHGPGSGVVDADLKVFGTNNLYICDGSVFTTAGSVNPSLTITALGLRLSAHLAGRSGINVVRAS